MNGFVQGLDSSTAPLSLIPVNGYLQNDNRFTANQALFVSGQLALAALDINYAVVNALFSYCLTYGHTELDSRATDFVSGALVPIGCS